MRRSSPYHRRSRRARAVFLAAGAAALLAPVARSAFAQTVTATWLNPVSGSWNDPTNWSSNPDYPNNDEPPGVSYNATISAVGAPYTIDLLNSVSLGTLTMSSADATLNVGPGGTLNLTTRLSVAGQVNLNGGQINITNFSTGLADVHGVGTFMHSAGTFNFGPFLTVGVIASDKSYYYLNGTGVLSGGQLNIGANVGDGTFQHDGGDVQLTTYLALGDDVDNHNTCTGVYNMTGGTVTSPIEYMGYSATGTFNQSGGTNNVTDPAFGIYLGVLPGSSGAYNLTGGTLSDGNAVIAYSGNATFNQSSGTHSVAGVLRVGRQATGNGTYLLSGDGVLYSGIPFVGYSGTGTFIQSGGEHHVTAAMFIGTQTGSRGSYLMSDGTLTIGASEQVGVDGSGAFVQSGGQVFVGNSITIAANPGSSGTYLLSGGYVQAANLVNNGTFISSAIGVGSFGQIAGSGTFTASGDSTITATSIRQSQFTLADTAQVAVRRNGSNAAVSRILSIGFDVPAAPTAVLDLNDNDLVTQTDPLTVQSTIAYARNGGAWDRGGITSNSARIQENHATTLGVLTGAEYIGANGGTTSFDNLSIAPTETLVKYTWYGDTDFNGIVNFDDYVRTDNGFNNNLTGWLNGDFDGNGQVNFDDYVLIDLAFNVQDGTLRRALGVLGGDGHVDDGLNDPAIQQMLAHLDEFGVDYRNHFLAAVPEPATVAATGVATSLAMLKRRPRRVRPQ